MSTQPVEVPETDLVSSELEDHTTAIEGWISQTEALDMPESYKTVAHRFVRDCRTTIDDIKACGTPSTNDLNDFENRKNSLESQFFSLSDEIS